ncbi:hypothetical protein DPMN_104310 [Dreissena polymorpha]|uniref:Endonuclease-reverse transcriptase n=1 Tax=Dreissena polymorpha TaxID=45954 RepID=A0A9D4JZX8_DREPO|nr:hypothetical protein DPMN_104310 [Dreissena polymorpha]
MRKEEGCAQGQHPSHIKNQHATETNTKENNNTGPRMQTRQETEPRTADHQISDILGPKSSWRVGCWNVRTLYQTGKLAQVVKEMESYGISLLGVSEAR